MAEKEVNKKSTPLFFTGRKLRPLGMVTLGIGIEAPGHSQYLGVVKSIGKRSS